MQRKKQVIILAVIAAIVSIGFFDLIRFTYKLKAIEISKGSKVIQKFLEIYPDARCKVTETYISEEGDVYAVTSSWQLDRKLGRWGKPIDGKPHYCWVVTWYAPKGWLHPFVAVCMDKDDWMIVLVYAAEFAVTS